VVSNTIQSAGGIKRISAAVFIAQKHNGAAASRQPQPRPPEELQKLRRIVQSALGIQETGDSSRKDEITLEEIPFNDQPAVELTQQIEKQEKRQFWFDEAQKLIYPALALGVLILFWRTFRRTKTPDFPIGIPVGEYGGNGNGHGNGHGRGHFGRPGDPQPGVVTADVLNQLIRENPASMSQAVRTWLTRGNASSK